MVAFGALEEFRTLALVLIPLLVVVLVAGAVAAGSEDRADDVTLHSAAVNLGGGVLAVALASVRRTSCSWLPRRSTGTRRDASTTVSSPRDSSSRSPHC